MATTAKRVKDARKPKFSSRKHNRCQICGRPRAFLRQFGLCVSAAWRCAERFLVFRSRPGRNEVPAFLSDMQD